MFSEWRPLGLYCLRVCSSCLSVWVTEHFHCWLRLLNNEITPVVIRSSDLRWSPSACLLSHILYSNPHTYLMPAHIRHLSHTCNAHIFYKNTPIQSEPHTHGLKSNVLLTHTLLQSHTNGSNQHTPVIHHLNLLLYMPTHILYAWIYSTVSFSLFLSPLLLRIQWKRDRRKSVRGI